MIPVKKQLNIPPPSHSNSNPVYPLQLFPPILVSTDTFYIAQPLLWQRAAEVMAGSKLHRLTEQQSEARRATRAFLWASLLSTYKINFIKLLRNGIIFKTVSFSSERRIDRLAAWLQ